MWLCVLVCVRVRVFVCLSVWVRVFLCVFVSVLFCERVWLCA